MYIYQSLEILDKETGLIVVQMKGLHTVYAMLLSNFSNSSNYGGLPSLLSVSFSSTKQYAVNESTFFPSKSTVNTNYKAV